MVHILNIDKRYNTNLYGPMTMANPIILVNSVSVLFSRWGQSVPALTNTSLEIFPKQWVMIVGHNGSGKSTFLKTIAGYCTPTHGKIEFPELKKTSDFNAFSSKIFYVGQDPLASTADKLTLIENLAVADPQPHCRWRRLSFNHDRYLKLLDEAGLSSRRNQLIKYFSGGERQQIALIIAKIRRPQILLLDEPLSALDHVNIDSCIKLISSMNLEGCTILQVSHDFKVSQSVGSRMVTFEQGKIISDKILI